MITKKCLICGKEFEVYPHQIKNGIGKFCSNKCSAKYRNKGKQIVKKCLVCKKEFRTYQCLVKKGYGKFCSRKCKGLFLRKKIIKTCLTCGNSFKVLPSRIKYGYGKFCSVKCCKKNKIGKNSCNWKGGKRKVDGYILIYFPKHPFVARDKYMRRSRLIAEKCLKRYLTKLEIIHHINEIKDDDKPKNLYLFDTLKKHNLYHRLKNKPILTSNLL